MKKWILDTFFKEELAELFRNASIDAFTKATEDLEETNVYNTDEKAKELMEQKLRELLSIVDFRHVLTFDKTKGALFLGGLRVEETRLQNLRSEAEILSQMDIWNVLIHTPKELAQRAMFISSESLDDLKKGKSMLYTLSSQENILSLLKAIKR